jgi:hypothetical protein
LEHVSRAQGQEYLEIIKNEAHDLLGMLDKLKINDEVGSPLLYEYPDVGWISPTTLRYIKVAADIRNLFGDLALARIAEIGVGYGGQFLILDQLYRMRYFLYDLPPVLEFASKYLESHILNSSYEAITLNQYDGVGEYDLVISNYAFSELPRQLQQKYIEKIIYKSKRGYLTMNSGLPNSVFKNNKMTIDELRKHLPEFEILEERPNTTPGNYIIVRGHKQESQGYYIVRQLIVLRLIGGLGNQLFQILYGRRIAESIDVKIVIDDSFLKNSSKKHEVLAFPELVKEYGVVTLGWRDLKVKRTVERIFYKLRIKLPKFYRCSYIFDETDPSELTSSQYIVDGFWQDKKFLDHNFLTNVREVLRSVSKEQLTGAHNENAICVHIRRGDFVTNRHWFRLQQIVLSMDYYLKAFDYFKKEFNVSEFHIYTDDEPWARQFFSENPMVKIISSSRLSPVDLLYEMTQYENFIIANSTLSWWAAVLAEAKLKRVVIPEIWGANQSNEKFCLDGWKSI